MKKFDIIYIRFKTLIIYLFIYLLKTRNYGLF